MEEETTSPAKINQIKITEKKEKKPEHLQITVENEVNYEFKIDLQNSETKMRLKKSDSGSLNRHVE